MPWSETEIEERFPVWDVLSEFWLDTHLVNSDYERIATELKKSPYTKDELFKICIYEVAPAVSGNLLSIAGEWGAFHPEWLKKRIIKKSPNSNDYLNPSIWRKVTGKIQGILLKSSGWNKIVAKL